MKKSIIAVLAVVALVMAGMVCTVAWASGDKGPADIKIQDKLFPKHTKSAVNFPHKKHYEAYKITCDNCHHVYKDGKNTWKEGDPVKPCAECHTSPKKNQGKLLSLYNAFHKNCKDCHKEAKKGPTKCNECHPK